MNQDQGSNGDRVDRRGFLECAAWAGTGLLWTVSGGILSSRAFGQEGRVEDGARADFTFVQISDTHFGFSKEPNKDPAATVLEAVRKVNALPSAPRSEEHTSE